MWNEADLYRIVTQFLPPDAKLLRLENPNRHLAVATGDLDGDNTHEIAAAYKWREYIGIIVLKWFSGYWYPISYIRGKGYGVTFLKVAPITGKDMPNLIIGWQLGSIYSQLDLLEWTGRDFRSLLDEEIFFSEIEVANIPTKEGFDKKLEIALWTHDTGEAYKVEVYHWDGKRLKPFPEAYPFYFSKVADYYQKQVNKLPNAAYYWYYLADAQTKAEQYSKALNSVETAIKLDSEYPSIHTLLELRAHILKKLERDLNLYPASIKTIEGTKWGYINNDGSFVIKPQFNNAMDFQDNGLAVVEKGNLYGIINSYGKFVVPPQYNYVNQFSEGRAVVIDDSGFKVIDENGKLITSQAYNYIGSYQNGRAVFSKMSEGAPYLYGYLDRQGNEVIPAQYLSAGDFNNEQALVQLGDNQFALIGVNGETLHTYNYAFVNTPGDGLLPFQPYINSKYGYIDINGNIVLQPQYSLALPFSDERAIVNMGENYTNKYGLIDKQGNFIIEPIYNDINLIGEKRAAVGRAIDPEQPFIGSKYAIADIEKGNILTDFIYTNVTSYVKGYASVSDGINTYFIDTNGKLAKSLPIVEGNGTLSFIGSLIKANVDFRVFYLDMSGKVIWQQNTEIPLNNQYIVKEEKYIPDINYLVYYPQISGIKDENIQQNVNERLKELSQVKPIEDQLPLNYSFTGDFSIEFFRKNLLVLELNSYQYYFGAAHGMPFMLHPNIDLVSGQFYQLKDLFKENSDYIKVLSDIIGEQIKTDPQYSYIFPDEYKGISADQPFYVKEDALYIYFAPYEIAPYAAGFPTFRIPYSEIMSIINKEGAFWKAFH